MLKSSILNVLNYHSSLKNSIKSHWITFLIVAVILIPTTLFLIFSFFETEIAALIMFLFPPSPRQGIAFYIDLVYLARTEILWFGFFFLVTSVLAVYPSNPTLNAVLALRVRKRGVYYMMLITTIFFFTTLLISSKTLEGFPNSSDEYAYLFQAEMFSRGKLWERAHDLPDFFRHNNIPQHDGILVSRFPPGWPILLSVAYETGVQPYLINPILGVLSLVVFYFFARRTYNEQVAVWSLAAMALSGYYIFNSASYFSHISCLLVTLLFVYNVYLYQEKNNFVYGLLAGFFLGFVIIIRYYTAVLIFLPFFIYLMFQYRLKAIYLFVLMGIGSIPCLAYLLWYNYSITGSALVPVTVWAYPSEQLGFVKGHSFLQGVEHLIRRILMFFYWSSPGLLLLYAVFLWQKIKSPVERLLRPEDYAFFSLAIGYFFYYQIGGNQYGPRFLFESLPFVVLFVVSKVLEKRERWAVALLVASILYAMVKFPFITERENRIVDERQNLYDLVQSQNITNAVVFVSSATSPIRPMPADDLTRNDTRFVNDVIYALELPHINHELMEYYPDRSFYRYVRDVNHPQGELIKVR
jgi:hypothetical protein